MKKKLLFILVATLCITMFTGCGDDSADTEVTDFPATTDYELLNSQDAEVNDEQIGKEDIAEEDDASEEFIAEVSEEIESEDDYALEAYVNEIFPEDGDYETVNGDGNLKYQVYESGYATLGGSYTEGDTILETVEYEGKNYEVVGLYNFNGIGEITVPSHIKYLLEHAFGNQWTKINIPDTVEYIDGDRLIGGGDAINLKEINFPAKISTKEEPWQYTFECADQLEFVQFPEGIKKMDNVFYQCNGIKEVILPDSVEELDGTFNGCVNLEKVNTPKNLKRIEGATFLDCKNLHAFDLPSALDYLDVSCFSFTGIEEIVFQCDVEKVIGVIQLGPDTTKVVFPSKANGGTLKVVAEESNALKEIVMPDDTEELVKSTFDVNRDYEYDITVKVPASILDDATAQFADKPYLHFVAK